MTVNQKIREALAPFGCPVKPDLYTGNEARWFTFNEADNRAALHANNSPRGDRVAMQIHFFLPLEENYLSERRRIRRALLNAGFTYPFITMLTEDDTRIRHIIFECEILEREE